jgi:DNA-binding transcriptional MocR family regulator
MKIESVMQHTYLQIARTLQTAIEADRYAVGEKLPSVRQYAQAMGVSMSSVTRCYRHLEALGYVTTRLKSGMYVADWKAFAPQRQTTSMTQASDLPAFEFQKLASVQDRLSQLHALTAQPLRLGLHLANATAAWYPCEALARIGQRLLRSQPELLGSYPTGTGLPALKMELVRHLGLGGQDLTLDDLLITHGGTEAMQLALRAVTQPGDTVVVESPVYFGLLQMVEGLGLKALEVPSTVHGQGISVEALAYALEHNSAIKAIVVMPSFQNPLGTQMTPAAKHQLIRLSQQYQVSLIEDDVFGDLSPDSERPQPLKAWDKLGDVIYCGSASKSISPAFRLGWIAAGRHQSRVNALKLSSTLSTPVFEQHVLATYFQSGALPAHLRTLRQRLQSCIQPATEAVKKYFPIGTKVTRPIGGWWLWIELPEPFDTMALLHLSVPLGIGFAPGGLFSTSSKFAHCMRLNIGRPWDREMEQGFKTLGSLAKQLMTPKNKPNQ